MVRSSAAGLHPQAGTVPGAGCTVPDAPALNAFPEPAFIDPKGTGKRGVMQTPATGDLDSVVTTGPTSQIGTSGGRLQVGWVHATANTAKVIQVHFSAQGAMFPYVKRPVRKLSTQQYPTQLCVPVPVDGALPEPATFMINNVPGPVVDERTVGGPGSPQSCVVLVAQSKLESTLNAVGIVN